ncbi:MAG: hypothetical protein KPEEDBHJ_01527 [Anaerolineales bacterium]|nr:hypothetical protein [Anaerolineales bacterium]
MNGALLPLCSILSCCCIFFAVTPSPVKIIHTGAWKNQSLRERAQNMPEPIRVFHPPTGGFNRETQTAYRSQYNTHMEAVMKRNIPLLVIVLVSLACQTLVPEPSPPPRNGTVISACADAVNGVRAIQPVEPPKSLAQSEAKDGSEFDLNEYFNVLTNLSMREGYVLDYIYAVDSLGSYPIPAARPVDQPPYSSSENPPEEPGFYDYWKYIEIKDTEQGYFEFAALRIMANQFYLVWHANYNDWQIVCDRAAVDAIADEINSGSYSIQFDDRQMKQIEALNNIEPLVTLTDTGALVEIVTFTKWGGFFRATYSIDRAFPHEIIETQRENIVPYDCGILF